MEDDSKRWADWLVNAQAWDKAETPWLDGDVTASVWSKAESHWWWAYPTVKPGAEVRPEAAASWSKVEGLWGDAAKQAWDKSEAHWWHAFPSESAIGRVIPRG